MITRLGRMRRPAGTDDRNRGPVAAPAENAGAGDMAAAATFVLARLAEDVDAARAASLDGAVWDDGGPGAFEDARTVVASDGALAHSGRGVAEVEPHALGHIARHDPAYVLADCAAKRLIVEDFLSLLNAHRTGWDVRSPRDYPVRALALPHADHPDYQPGWRP